MKMCREILGIVILLMTTTCVDPISFNFQEPPPQLVIYGTYTQLNQDHEVSIRTTGEFGTLDTHLAGAIVRLLDENGATAQYNETEGKYILPKGIIQGETGKSYKIEVVLPDGRRYESPWQQMPEPVNIEDKYYRIEYRKALSESDVIVEQFFVDVFISSPLKTKDDNKVFLRWEIDETWSLTDKYCGAFDNVEACYYRVNNSFEKVKLFSSIDNSQEDLEDYPLYSRVFAPYIEFNELHYFNIYQYSIDESTFDYWEKIDVVSNQSGSVFDKLPSGVHGNIGESGRDSKILGYFEVAAATIARVVTTREGIREMVVIPRQCSPYISHFRQPNYCCYCDLLPNRIPRPEYWGER